MEDKRTAFTVGGKQPGDRNICGHKIRQARHIPKVPLKQEDLAMKIQKMGYSDMTKAIISRIERGERPIIDAELVIFARALGVSLDWLTEDFNLLNDFPT
jgi:transcriptional regulator with XRE-family HTH domain